MHCTVDSPNGRRTLAQKLRGQLPEIQEEFGGKVSFYPRELCKDHLLFVHWSSRICSLNSIRGRSQAPTLITIIFPIIIKRRVTQQVCVIFNRILLLITIIIIITFNARYDQRLLIIVHCCDIVRCSVCHYNTTHLLELIYRFREW